MLRRRYCRKQPENGAPALGGTDDAPELEGGTRKKARCRVGGVFDLESDAFGLEAGDDVPELEDGTRKKARGQEGFSLNLSRRRKDNFSIRPTAGYQLRHLDGASSFNVVGFIEGNGAIDFNEGCRTAGELVADIAFVHRETFKGTKDRPYKCRLI